MKISSPATTSWAMVLLLGGVCRLIDGLAPTLPSTTRVRHFGTKTSSSFSSSSSKTIRRGTVECGIAQFRKKRSEGANDLATSSQRTGWHRRVFRVVLRQSKKSKSLNMLQTAPAIDLKTMGLHNDTSLGFLVEELERLSPQDVFAPIPHQEQSIHLATSTVAKQTETATYADSEGTTIEQSLLDRFPRLLKMFSTSVLQSMFDRWSTGDTDDVRATCDPKVNYLQLLCGQFRCDARVDFERLVFPAIRMSGGRLEVKGLALNLRSFGFGRRRGLPGTVHRFPEPFEIQAHDLVFTKDDLLESPCIRRGLKRILTRILDGRGLTTLAVTVDSIDILPSGKIACKGEAKTLGSGVPFEVRTGLGIASRGHVLTLPGLEISLSPPLGPPLGFYVPVLPMLTVDLGHNTRLLRVDIDGSEQDPKMHISASVTITPEHTIKLLHSYSQSSKSYAATCSVDVGRWVTRLGQFSK